MVLVTVDVPVEDVEIVPDTVDEDERVSVRDDVGVGLVDRVSDKVAVKVVETVKDAVLHPDLDSDAVPVGVCDDETRGVSEPV